MDNITDKDLSNTVINDKIEEVKQALLNNSNFNELVEVGSIRFYEIPEGIDIPEPVVIITPLDVPYNGIYGSDEVLSLNFLYQIDVQSDNRNIVKEVQYHIKKVMKELGFSQLPNGLDAYFREKDMFVDARRYELKGKLHDTKY